MDPTKFSRRSFLANTASGAAGIALAAHTAAGAAQSPSSDKEPALRWGIIGTGTRGMWTHVRVLKSAPDSQIFALCDVSEQRLQVAASNAGGHAATYSDYQKLLANPDVNAVVIAVPNLLHREMLLAALQAGTHVLCEKPAGATPADAAAMKQAADSAKTIVMFGMQYRNNPRQQQIHQLIADGRIGKPRYIVQNCSRGDWNTSPNVWQFADPKLGGKPMNWRFSHTASGGTLNEFDCHYFDLLHWMADALPDHISCDGGISVYHDGRDTWDHATVTLKYPNDVTAVHTLCLFGPGRADVAIMGDKGSIDLTGDLIRVHTRDKRGAARTQEIRPTETKPRSTDDTTLKLYEDFLECLQTGKKPDASPERAVAASRTCWVAELAAQRKAEVKWDDLA